MNDSIVIIPTYNEKENIEAISRAVTGLEKGFDVLVIDDGSPDGTAGIVRVGFILSSVAASWVWVRRISVASSGPSSMDMTISSRWMLISAIILMICLNCMRRATWTAMMWLWGADISRV